MSKTSRTKYTLLGMLSIKPMSGYEIKQAIAESTRFFWSESDGQIYPALAACEKEGTIKQIKIKKSSKGRDKKVYAITKTGESHLSEWLKQSVQTTLVRNELLLKLFFGANVPTAENIQHIREHQRKTVQELKQYQQIKSAIEQQHSDSKHAPYWLLTLDYGIKMTKQEINWCKHSIRLLEK